MTSAPDQPKAEDIPLEDLDKLLEAEDPEFTKSLEEVRAVESDKNATIEATVVPEDDAATPQEKPKELGRIARARLRVRLAMQNAKHNAKDRLKAFGKAALIFLKTKPKEYALYSIVLIKAAIKNITVPINAFRNASRLQRFGGLALVLIGTATLWVLLNNLRGIWLPLLNEPMLTNLADNAAVVETFDPKEGGESFYSAFPQERHEYLFDKMKVNLKRTTENPNPMGAFEVIVVLDSKDTAVEVRDRKVEFFDHLQRVFEDETFPDLDSKLGKDRLKGRLKRELNQKLTQGWVKDINFQTFILKP